MNIKQSNKYFKTYISGKLQGLNNILPRWGILWLSPLLLELASSLASFLSYPPMILRRWEDIVTRTLNTLQNIFLVHFCCPQHPEWACHLPECLAASQNQSLHQDKIICWEVHRAQLHQLQPHHWPTLEEKIIIVISNLLHLVPLCRMIRQH